MKNNSSKTKKEAYINIASFFALETFLGQVLSVSLDIF